MFYNIAVGINIFINLNTVLTHTIYLSALFIDKFFLSYNEYLLLALPGWLL